MSRLNTMTNMNFYPLAEDESLIVYYPAHAGTSELGYDVYSFKNYSRGAITDIYYSVDINAGILVVHYNRVKKVTKRLDDEYGEGIVDFYEEVYKFTHYMLTKEHTNGTFKLKDL